MGTWSRILKTMKSDSVLERSVCETESWEKRAESQRVRTALQKRDIASALERKFCGTRLVSDVLRAKWCSLIRQTFQEKSETVKGFFCCLEAIMEEIKGV